MKLIDPTLFPEIAEFWADINAIPGLKEEIAEAKSNVICVSCPECQWMARDRLRGFCRTQHNIVFPLENARGTEEDRENYRMPIRFCSTLNKAVEKATKEAEEAATKAGNGPQGLPGNLTFEDLMAASSPG